MTRTHTKVCPSILCTLILFLVGSAAGIAYGQTPDNRDRISLPATGAIAITNVTLIDVTNGAQKAAMTVVMEAGRIAAIGRAISMPRGAIRVDG